VGARAQTGCCLREQAAARLCASATLSKGTPADPALWDVGSRERKREGPRVCASAARRAAAQQQQGGGRGIAAACWLPG
jgi:hypothetical protein